MAVRSVIIPLVPAVVALTAEYKFTQYNILRDVIMIYAFIKKKGRESV